MTMAINNHNVSKSVIHHAVEMAIKGNTNVVIFGAEMPVKDGKETKHLVVTAAEWETCDNKDELSFVTAIDSDGNFVD